MQYELGSFFFTLAFDTSWIPFVERAGDTVFEPCSPASLAPWDSVTMQQDCITFNGSPEINCGTPPRS